MGVKRLFIGGIPADVEFSSQRHNVHFEGCIWNLMINTMYISQKNHSALREMYCIMQGQRNRDVFIRLLLPRPLQASRAAEESPVVLKKAKQFGFSKNSHFEFDDTKVKNRLIIEFELQITAESGLVFYMPRINHADFATIQVKEGMAHLGYDLGYDNTSVVRKKQRGVLVIDNRYSKHTTSPKKADILDVVGMIGPVLYRINGCIRNFKMLGIVLDMDTPTSNHQAGSCFIITEKGTYFDGTGYIKLLFHVDNWVGRFTWHSVTVHKLRHRLEIIVDGRKEQAESQKITVINQPLSFISFPEGLKQFGLTTSTSFKGCMRNLKITKASKVLEVQFNKGLEFKGFQPLTCPANAA
uniref:Laminin G domain-containing protein n=1 Tax=Oncorhynchus tshawytscha TaxID=74940 RepID=A0AAZ3SH21_ONCTS